MTKKSYKVFYTRRADKAIQKLDPFIRKLILSWIEKNLEGCIDPRKHGKGLTGDFAGEWRYRVGDYRIICEIDDDRILILVLVLGHRRDVYQNN